MRKVLSIFILLFYCITAFAETNITTEFPTRRWTPEKDGVKASIQQVIITDYYTYVVIDFQFSKKYKQFPIFTGPNCHLLANGKKYPIIGMMNPDGTIKRCFPNDDLCWDNVAKGATIAYMLVFSGRIEPGVTNISLVDKGISHGYNFSNITIKNPPIVGGNPTAAKVERDSKSLIDAHNDGIHGIYESVGSNGCRVSVVKCSDGWWGFYYISDNNGAEWWHPQDYKAVAEETATRGLMHGTWFKRNKQFDSNALFSFNGNSFTVKYGNIEETYIKIYPANQVSPSAPTKPITPSPDNIWTGTGWSLLDNYIVTNYHVVDGAKTIKVSGIGGDLTRSCSGIVVASDKINDIAIVRLNNVSITNIPYAVTPNLAEVGEEIFVLGFPMTQSMGNEIKYTTGEISALSGFEGDVANYQISAPIQPGNSGGPMFDEQGNVIGIVVAKHNGAELVSYAIKTSYLQNLMLSQIGRNLFPSSNRLSSLKRKDKIKEAKKFVYYIMCSDTADANL